MGEDFGFIIEKTITYKKERKFMKKNNKGFSLVELIIVIAIMAILAGAIAPALIRYIDKSRKSNDVSSAKTIKTAVETALGNEDIYAYLTNNSGKITTITIAPGVATSGEGAKSAAITIAGCTEPTDKSVSSCDDLAKSEIGTNIGEKTPKLKYKKANKDEKASKCKVEPKKFYALINDKGTVFVLIGGDTAPKTIPGADGKGVGEYTEAYPICPESCGAYQ